MALPGRSRQDGRGDARGNSPRASHMPPVQYRSAQMEPSGLGDSLERKWEEAWRRARAADYTSK